jgi:RsiW-degrading membrane proteinase PrsW (M82 family)
MPFDTAERVIVLVILIAVAPSPTSNHAPIDTAVRHEKIMSNSHIYRLANITVTFNEGHMTSPTTGGSHSAATKLDYLPKRAGTRSTALYWAIAGLLAVIMLVIGLISLALNAVTLGLPVFLGALFLSILPVPIYLGLFLWLDRFEPEPPALLVLTFLWGACVSIFFAGCLNSINGALIHEAGADASTANQLMASLSAPLTEETWKGLAILMLVVFRRKDFDGVLDGIIYAGVTALGFAMAENVQYYGRALGNGGLAALGFTFILRGVMSPYTHLLFTSMTGIGFGLAASTRNIGLKIVLPVLGWMTAMFLHFLWNTIPGLFGHYGLIALLVSYFIFWIPVFIVLIALVFWSLKRESRMIRTELGHYVNAGELTTDEAAMLTRLWPRFNGMGVGPVPNTPWSIRRKYTRLATALAFYRHRVATGHSAEDAEYEAAHLTELRALRGGASPVVKPTTT